MYLMYKNNQLVSNPALIWKKTVQLYKDYYKNNRSMEVCKIPGMLENWYLDKISIYFQHEALFY